MHPFDDDYLSKMLPGFEKKPQPEIPVLPLNEPVDESPATEHSAPELFNAIAALISQYLACDRSQLTVLTLWIAHTWFFRSLRTAAYLDVRSPEPQSGKSVCMMLIRQLSRKPTFATGASAESLKKYLLVEAHRFDDNKFDTTIFLDDCHHTFGPSERQPIVALLNSGSDAGPCYFAAPHEYYVFGPKAFAGNAPLPKSLASRCIPITLSRRRPSDVLKRFDPFAFRDAAVKLLEELVPWINANRSALDQAGQNAPPDIPPGLTPREQSCAEPLFHIADLVGGAWPDKARAAISNIFKLAEGSTGVELLCDLRGLFFTKSDPEYLSTKDIISGLRELEHRPWSGWGPNSGKRLGGLLHPFGIHSRLMHYGSSPNFRGYLFQHFQDAWERYVPPITIQSETKNPSEPGSEPKISNDYSQLHGITESAPI